MRKATKSKDMYEWHDWFVWYPIWVHTANCKGTWIFWEKVQRKYQGSYAGTYKHIRNLDGSDIE